MQGLSGATFVSLWAFSLAHRSFSHCSNIAAEGDYADRRQSHSPGGEKDPSHVEDEFLNHIHGIVPRGNAYRNGAGQARNANPALPPIMLQSNKRTLLLLRCGWCCALHVLLHVRLVIGLNLFQLGLLIRCEQLVDFVMNPRLLHLQLHQRLRLLGD